MAADVYLNMWRAGGDWQDTAAPYGDPFTLNAFDMARQLNYDGFGLPNTFHVFIEGYQADGNVLERSVTFSGGNPYFQHFTFTGWTL